MSRIEIWSAVAPSTAAILPSIPCTFTEPDEAALESPVSIATICAPSESPTNRIPSGPKASGPADLTSAFPMVMPVVAGAATARLTMATNRTSVNRRDSFIEQVLLEVNLDLDKEYH